MSKRAQQGKVLPLNIYSRTGNKSLDETVLQPYAHISKFPNRAPIKLITTAFNGWYKIPADKVYALEEILQIASNSGYLCDDIEDGSVLRSGKPVAHSIYGVASTLAAANYTSMIALEKIWDMVDAETTENREETIIKHTELILEALRGNGMDIYWRENFICPTEEEYCQMGIMKTSAMFKLAVSLISACSPMNEDFSKFIDLMALGFQIVNDYENLTSEECHKMKTFCEDITEGKFSFPITHAVNSRPEDHRIMEILRLRTTDYKLKRQCLDLIEECGSLEYTKNKIAEIREEMTQEAKKFGPNPKMDTLIAFVFGKKE